MDWFLYDREFCHEGVKVWNGLSFIKYMFCKIHGPKLLLVFQENIFRGTLLKTLAVLTRFFIETLYFSLVAIYFKF